MMRSADLSPLQRALTAAKKTLISVGVFSFFINLLMLVAPLYMLQVYDRVLASRNRETLLFLTVVAAGALMCLGMLELARSRLLVREGARFDRFLSGGVFSGVLAGNRSAQPLRDLDNVRAFFTGPSFLHLLDAPWVPGYVAVIYIFHPWLGNVALIGATSLFALGLLNERLTRESLGDSASEAATAHEFAETSARNTPAILAMGMLPGLRKVWRTHHSASLGYQAVASDRAANIAATAKFLRFFMQVGILGMGAYLAIDQIITPGAMIAASIIMGRALSPVEGSIGGWRAFILARGSYQRLKDHLDEFPDADETMPLPVPRGAVSFQDVSFVPEGAERPILMSASFELAAGETLGIIGPSAAGKSTIAKLMVGVWKPTAGHVRLDAADVGRWRSEVLGPHIGYLPQDIELFPGSVADNIARFGEPDAEKIVEAAKLADAHEIFLQLPQGYDTVLGSAGYNVSGGQRQRIGLARAFYGSPSLVVLDEPTSNLDADGEAAVTQAIESVKQRGNTAVVIAHRPAIIVSVDKLLVVQKGMLTDFGPVQDILPKMTRRVVRDVPHADAEIVAAALKGGAK